MPLMIRGWRPRRGQGISVPAGAARQLHPALPQPGPSEWAELREAQAAA